MILKSQQQQEKRRRKAEDVFSLKIQAKLSLYFGALILFVIAVLITIVTTRQTVILTENADKISQTLLQSVAATAKDELLLESELSVQDMLINLKRMNVGGLKYVAVSNRAGKVVAHTETSLLGDPQPKPKTLTLRELPDNKLVSKSADVVVGFEDEETYYYLDSIFVRKQAQRLFLGTIELAFSKELIQRPIRDQTRTILIVGILIFLAGQLIGFFVSKGIVSAVISISEAARKVAEGDLNVRVIIKGKDELAELAREFNKMVMLIRQKIEMEKFLSEMTVEMITDRSERGESIGGEEVFTQDQHDSVERREIAVFFSDIRGFTSLSERLEPEQALQIVNIYLDLQTQIVKRYGGIIDKFMGDGMMCIFRGQDMTDRAVLAALEIQSSVFNTNKTRSAHGLNYAAVGIGISVGKAVLGNVGSQRRRDYTAIGDVVNLSSRLCSIADAYNVLVSESVIRNLKQNYSFRTMQTIKVKGKENPVEVYSIEVNRSQFFTQRRLEETQS